jgi:CheY-like chemotaxis protein
LVLLDIRLPDINGFEVARRFKKINPNIPIIAQTAYSIKSEKIEAFNAGCDGFLVKPISKDLLLEMVYECLVRKDKVSVSTNSFNNDM